MKKLFLLLFLVVLISAGCSKDELKPSEDSLLAVRAIDSISSIKTAYEKKNKALLKNRLSPELAEKALNELSFIKADLSLTSRMVTIEDSTVKLNMNWNGSWLVSKGSELENRGTVNLILDKDTMTLIKIEGDNPFSIPLLRTH